MCSFILGSLTSSEAITIKMSIFSFFHEALVEEAVDTAIAINKNILLKCFHSTDADIL